METEKSELDFWSKTSNENFCCKTCMSYVNFRCRKRAPTDKGFPPVMPTDWCGDHRLSKSFMERCSPAEKPTIREEK